MDPSNLANQVEPEKRPAILRPRPPLVDETELFHFGPCIWDITYAKYLLNDREPQARIDVASWYIIAGIIDVVYGQETDRNSLPILAWLPGRPGEVGSEFLIDGWQRLGRAHRAGIHWMAAHRLTPDESQAIRLDNFKPKKYKVPT